MQQTWSASCFAFSVPCLIARLLCFDSDELLVGVPLGSAGRVRMPGGDYPARRAHRHAYHRPHESPSRKRLPSPDGLLNLSWSCGIAAARRGQTSEIKCRHPSSKRRRCRRQRNEESRPLTSHRTRLPVTREIRANITTATVRT